MLTNSDNTNYLGQRTEPEDEQALDDIDLLLHTPVNTLSFVHNTGMEVGCLIVGQFDT